MMTDRERATEWARDHAPMASEARSVVAEMFGAWYVSDADEMAYWERCDIGMTRIFDKFMEAEAATVAQAIRAEDASRDLLAGFNV